MRELYASMGKHRDQWSKLMQNKLRCGYIRQFPARSRSFRKRQVVWVSSNCLSLTHSYELLEWWVMVQTFCKEQLSPSWGKIRDGHVRVCPNGSFTFKRLAYSSWMLPSYIFCWKAALQALKNLNVGLCNVVGFWSLKDLNDLNEAIRHQRTICSETCSAKMKLSRTRTRRK